MFFKPLYDTDVRQTQRPAAFEYQPDFRTGRRCRLRKPGNKRDSDEKAGEADSMIAALHGN
jgi:hypothetical protein